MKIKLLNIDIDTILIYFYIKWLRNIRSKVNNSISEDINIKIKLYIDEEETKFKDVTIPKMNKSSYNKNFKVDDLFNF